MDLLHTFVDMFLHLDKHLVEIVAQYQYWTYGILFAIVFAETGLVVTPFLPGDSLLFAVGTLSASSEVLRLEYLFPLLLAAVFLGDNTNYWLGRTVGPKIFSRDDVKLFNKKHLDRTHAFFERYGPKAVIMARFVPIVRTFMPFVAGIGAMPYPRFLAFSVAGCLLWLCICMFAGFFFGALPIVKKNFSLVVLAIIFISILPAVIEIMRSRKEGH
ncbi:MAG: DedA family protein [Armatimonadetes bacterium]|nr:DedA family protein [Armatimonadota bacterium]